MAESLHTITNTSIYGIELLQKKTDNLAYLLGGLKIYLQEHVEDDRGYWNDYLIAVADIAGDMALKISTDLKKQRDDLNEIQKALRDTDAA